MKTVTLQNTVVSRCGKTARYTNEETRIVKLSAASKENALRLFFTISSKGGGETEIYVDVGEKDFADIVAVMFDVSRATTARVASAALAAHLADAEKHDETVKEAARAELVALAKAKFDDAPSDDDAAQKLVYNGVAKLAKELREAESGGEEEDAAE